MHRKKVYCAILAMLFAFMTGCTGAGSENKDMLICSAGGATTIEQGKQLQFSAQDKDGELLDGAIFSVISGSAEITADGLLTCKADAVVDTVIKISATLKGYSCENFLLTVKEKKNNETEEPPVKEPESVWNVQPTVKNEFYEDFSKGISNSVWEVSNQKWGANNNGTSSQNVFYSTDPANVEAFGASKGVAVLQSNGDFFKTENRRRQGSCLITKQAYGPGRYEVRLKVVPRLGQCSTIWTYYNGGGGRNFQDYLQNKYSEIDIETALWADYRNILGVSYQYYSDAWTWPQVQQRRDSKYLENKSLSPYNDGKWHTLCFDWRTDKKNNDRAVIWYLDGKEFGRATNWVPEYKATFWIGNWFPDDVSWLGDPLFDTAYMYIDWVKITEYDDPVSEGARGGSGGTATDLGSAPIPQNNYITNGNFSQPLTVKNTKGADITSWVTENAAKVENRLDISSGGKAAQTISAQYDGYTFSLDVDAQITGGTGKCKVYAEYLSGQTNVVNPALSVVGKSDAIEFTSQDRIVKNLTFTVKGGFSVQYVRIIIETESGTAASIYDAKMYLQ